MIMKYISILEKMATVLERNDHAFQQTLLNKLIARLRNGEKPSILITNDIWGGEGSITDCNLLSPNGPTQPSEKAKMDDKELNGLLAELSEHLLAEHLLVNEVIVKRLKHIGISCAESASRPEMARRIRNM